MTKASTSKTASIHCAKPFFFGSTPDASSAARLSARCGGSIALIAFAMALGCGHESTPPVAPSTPNAVASSSAAQPASSNAAPEMAPAPYTAEQIRDANRPGTIYRFKVEASGEPAQVKVLEFTAGTSAEGAEVKNEMFDEAGKVKGPAKVERASWAEVRKHGEFPRDAVKVEPGSIEVPAGKFDATIYTLNLPNGETMRFYFAKSYAGPPVLSYKERGGVRLFTSTLIERREGK
jgi:hypothetical protein